MNNSNCDKLIKWTPKTKSYQRSQSRSKKQKTEKPSEPEFSRPDLISRLPDTILCLIISCLDTKSAIRTSLIAKRYKLLWTQLQNLHFYSTPSDDSRFSNFEAKISHLLRRRDHSINLTSFRLSIYHRTTPEFLENCVNYAASHNVQHFRMRAYIEPHNVLLPTSLRNSSSLVSLCLSNAVRGGLLLPMAVNMVNLKELYLKKIEFSSQSYDGRLFYGCPNLERLTLNKCWIKPDDALKVLLLNCANLRELVIKHWRGLWRCFDESSIEINAPKLASFVFQGLIVRVVCKEILACLDSVDFDLSYPTGCAEPIVTERKQRTLESIVSMLRWLCKAKSMSLSWKTYEVLCNDPDLRLHSPITFANLKFIKITTERMHTQIRILAQTVRESISPDTFIFDGPKQVDPETGETYEPEATFGVPKRVLDYFMDNCPSVEFFYFDLYKNPPDEDEWKRISGNFVAV